jgi:hypothetical protein
MSPISGDPAARARQIAALRPGAGAARPGEMRGLRHGGRSQLLVADVESEVRELMEALGEAAPVREHGELPLADVAMVETAARSLKRYRHLAAWLDLHGRLTEKGDVKPAAKLELQAEASLTRALDALGMSPASRARIGVSVAAVESYTMRLQREAEEARRNGGGR